MDACESKIVISADLKFYIKLSLSTLEWVLVLLCSFSGSLHQHGEAYENPIAERINGIFKTEFSLNRVFNSRVEALLAVRIAVEAYNNVRPHMSCSNLVPAIAHEMAVPLVKYWKNRRKKNTIVQLLNQQK